MFTCKMTLFLILFGAPIIIVVFGDHTDKANPSRIALEDKFKHEFYVLPNVGEALVWKIPRDQKIYEKQDYSQGFKPFEPNEICLIFTQAIEKKYKVLYWSGISATIDDKKHAAEIAVTMQHLISDYKKIKVELSRELAPYESDIYNLTIKRLEKIAEPLHIDYAQYLNNNFPLQRPNLYLIKGTERAARSKKEVINTKKMKEEHCILAETGSCYVHDGSNPVLIYCGSNAPRLVQIRARRMGNAFHNVFFNTWEDEENEAVANINTAEKIGKLQYSSLLEILEDCVNQRAYDDISTDETRTNDEFVTLRDQVVKVHKFYNDRGEMKMSEIRNVQPVSSIIFNDPKTSFLLNSSSVAGFFLLLGEKATLNEKIYAIQKAEQHVQDVSDTLKRLILMRIVNQTEDHLMFDFEINLVDRF